MIRKMISISIATASVLVVLAGCAGVGGESKPFPGIDFPPTPDDSPLTLFRTELPECPFEEIGSVEAHAPLKASAEEIENASDREFTNYLDGAEREARVEFRRRVRAMGGHGVIRMTHSLPGAWERDRGAIGEGLYDDDPEDRESISYTWGEGRPRYVIRGTVIRFTDPACRE